VLREYLEQVAVARPFFAVAVQSPDSEFVAEAPLHPVFRISAIQPSIKPLLSA
jgi:hypothetical protein